MSDLIWTAAALALGSVCCGATTFALGLVALLALGNAVGAAGGKK